MTIGQGQRLQRRSRSPTEPARSIAVPRQEREHRQVGQRHVLPRRTTRPRGARGDPGDDGGYDPRFYETPPQQASAERASPTPAPAAATARTTAAAVRAAAPAAAAAAARRRVARDPARGRARADRAIERGPRRARRARGARAGRRRGRRARRGVAVTTIDTVVDGRALRAGHPLAGRRGLEGAGAPRCRTSRRWGPTPARPTCAGAARRLPAERRARAGARAWRSWPSRPDVTIAGGDVIASPVLFVTRRRRPAGPTTRTSSSAATARGPGDLVGVTGELGGSAAGLLLLATPRPAQRRCERDALIQRHRRPRPRLPEGARWPRRARRAMIDLSDGIATDARHLAQRAACGSSCAWPSCRWRRASRRSPRPPAAMPTSWPRPAATTTSCCSPARPSAAPTRQPGGALTWIGEVSEGEGLELATPRRRTCGLRAPLTRRSAASRSAAEHRLGDRVERLGRRPPQRCARIVHPVDRQLDEPLVDAPVTFVPSRAPAARPRRSAPRAPTACRQASPGPRSAPGPYTRGPAPAPRDASGRGCDAHDRERPRSSAAQPHAADQRRAEPPRGP